MQYDAKTPKEYMELLAPDWRKDRVEELRGMIKKLCPELKEGIEYKALSYGNGSKNIFHINAQMAHVGLYVGNIDKIENARELLKEFSMGKGCIRIKKSIALPDTKIDIFIEKVMELWKKGENTDC